LVDDLDGEEEIGSDKRADEDGDGRVGEPGDDESAEQADHEHG
jgi:hypothetical protein